jgi:hypothetical protein
MPRPRKPHWHGRDRATRPGSTAGKSCSGNRDGTKVAHGDDRGVREAVDRLLAERDAGVRRALDPTVGDVCRDYLIAASAECEVDTMPARSGSSSGGAAFGDPPYGDRPARSIDSADLHRMRGRGRPTGTRGGCSVGSTAR